MSVFVQPSSLLLHSLPPELHLHIVTFLRAYDLGSIQQTCRYFNDSDHITTVIDYFSNVVYPPEFTKGHETAPPLFGGGEESKKPANRKRRGNKGGKKGTAKEEEVPAAAIPQCNLSPPRVTYESLRDMEMLVLLRALNRREPPRIANLETFQGNDDHDEELSQYYVSKSWCKSALKWLEVQEEARRTAAFSSSQGHLKTKKLSKKQQRLRDRRLSDVCTPWPNVNHDILCPHMSLRRCNSKSARAKRRVMDKQAWKVLRKLYPESTQLKHSGDIMEDECIQCLMEQETSKREELKKKERENMERKKPLGNVLIRDVFKRGNKGVPQDRIVSVDGKTGPSGACPLMPGVYHAIPRAWCHRWRKYMKTGCGGGGTDPCDPPEGGLLLCDAHKLPLVPPHLEKYLFGETSVLLAADEVMDADMSGCAALASPARASVAVAGGRIGSDHEADVNDASFATSQERANVLAALGLVNSSFNLEHELENQRAALRSLGVRDTHDEPSPQPQPYGSFCLPTTPTKYVPYSDEKLDKDNQVVVEILTDEEYMAMEEEFWPEASHGSFTMKFAIMDGSNIMWSTHPCRECDAGHTGASLVVRNRRKSRGGGLRKKSGSLKSY